MDYQGLKRQVDKLQEENVRMKVALRQLRTENHHLLTRSRRNIVSHGSVQDCSVSAEQDPSALQHRPKTFCIQLQEKGRKMAVAWPDSQQTGQQKLQSALAEPQASVPQRTPLQSAGDAAAQDTNQTFAPLKKRMGVDRAHPLMPVVMKKIHNNAMKDTEVCQSRPMPLSSQPMMALETNGVSSKRCRVVKANEYMAWSIDSMGDNIMHFCKDLLHRAKAKEAKCKVTEMSDIIYYESPERLQPLSSADTKTNIESHVPDPCIAEPNVSESCIQESCALESNPKSTMDTSIKWRSRLPYLKRAQILKTINTLQPPPQSTKAPNQLPTDEQNSQPCSNSKSQDVMETGSSGKKRTKSRLKRIKKSTKSSTAQNSVHKMEDDPPCPRTLPLLMSTCIPQTESPVKLPQGPPVPSSLDQHRPVSRPQLALDHTLRLLGSDCCWQQKMEGLTQIRRLAQWHSDVLAARVHDICLAVIQEVQNLRSQVSRAAVTTLGDLYLHLQCAMDTELEWTAKALLHKAGESNHFIRQDVGMALRQMLRSCTPSRSMKALLNGGLRHQNVAVRECAARQLEALVESMGTVRLLCCRKELLHSFLSAVSRLPQDASPEVRYCGQKIMGILRAHQDFQKKMKKFFP